MTTDTETAKQITFDGAAEAATFLRDGGLEKLGQNDRDFAQSLLHSYAKKPLSPKQREWLIKMAERAANPKAPPKPAAEVGDMSGLIDLFDLAKTHLQYPAVALQTTDGTAVRVYPAPMAGKNAGFVYVKTDDTQAYLGKVSPTGEWFPTREMAESDLMHGVELLLHALAKDPAGTAAQYGRLTGRCCFCRSALTNKKSTDVGYGPVCADHFGLSWGSKPAKVEAKPDQTSTQEEAEEIYTESLQANYAYVSEMIERIQEKEALQARERREDLLVMIDKAAREDALMYEQRPSRALRTIDLIRGDR